LRRLYCTPSSVGSSSTTAEDGPLDIQITEVAGKFHVDRSRTWLVGYSAGGSRVITAGRGFAGRLAGIACVAGDIGRAAGAADLELFRDRKVLLVCMASDPGENTSCRRMAGNVEALRAAGFMHVETTTLPGTHILDPVALAPVLARWIDSPAVPPLPMPAPPAVPLLPMHAPPAVSPLPTRSWPAPPTVSPLPTPSRPAPPAQERRP
jgi:hypothetical protein